jgi:predicted small lipoprotein YifL
VAVLRGLPLRYLVLVAALALIAGCGKKGMPIAPEALVPAPIKDLAVAQQGGHFLVSWSAPSKEEGGAPLKNLAGFLLFRRIVLPADQDCEECSGAYSELAKVDLDYLQGVRRIGNRFLLEDFDLRKQQSYQYKVRSFTTEKTESRDSNKVRLTAVTPPLPPVVEALSSATGVVLAFVALPPEEGTFVGYNIYRAKAGGEMPLAPLNAAPLTGTTYEDKELLVGVRYLYTVTSVATINGKTVESAPSNEAEGAISERD